MRVDRGRTPGLAAHRRFPEVQVRKRPNCQSWKIEASINPYAPSTRNALPPEFACPIQCLDHVRGFGTGRRVKKALDSLADGPYGWALGTPGAKVVIALVEGPVESSHPRVLGCRSDERERKCV
jgi:hypothetical protein